MSDAAPPPNLAVLLLDKFGEEAQLRQTVEELCELAVAINHYQRGRIAHVLGLRDEIADVEIMLEQLRHMIDAEDPGAMDRARARKRAKALALVTGPALTPTDAP